MNARTATIVKFGGSLLEDAGRRRAALTQFARVEGPRVLVHGGGQAATVLGERLGVAPRIVDGRRITDRETLDIVTMVYGGLFNRTIVAELQALHCRTCGVAGADCDILRAERRPVRNIDYGHVGDITRVNPGPLIAFLEQGIIPVIAPLTHDGGGGLLNTNADSIAGAVAAALTGSREIALVYCLDRPGVGDADGKTLRRITPEMAEEHRARGVITSGMLPKLENAFAALRGGVSRVVICGIGGLIAAANGDEGAGTEVCL